MGRLGGPWPTAALARTKVQKQRIGNYSCTARASEARQKRAQTGITRRLPYIYIYILCLDD